ncbi:hypothetical protein MIMGU_mgv11b022640mg [Erythranthe guttata]|uniref:Malectin-like domain-containing protein n=1 Tax=Erythranthe guttata TaxID=4155 RepID=A0A022RLP7_ERYGU|nr:hypothetical protein MIMGU_mgv11b022640mg [Erythranthe guttata]
MSVLVSVSVSVSVSVPVLTNLLLHIIRYKDDPYDRLWTPAVTYGLINVPSDTSLAPTTALDQPPPAVLQNAVTAVTHTTTIPLFVAWFPRPVGFPIYLNMYFSEFAELDATTQKRSFQVLMDNELLSDRPVVPPYGDCMELPASNLIVTSKTSFTLVPTYDSTLPPLINAMEVFYIGNLLTVGTRHLSSFDLTGVVPDFSTMDALETMNLASNQFSAPIPDSLSKKNGLNLV